MDEADDHTIFLRSRTDKTYVGPSFPTLTGQRLRIANKYIDGGGGYEFATVKDEVVLRTTPGGRFQIKATFVADDRSFRTVTIQKFTSNGRGREYFTLLPAEVATLLKFLSNIKRIHFPNEGKINITDADLEELLLNPTQIKRLATGKNCSRHWRARRSLAGTSSRLDIDVSSCRYSNGCWPSPPTSRRSSPSTPKDQRTSGRSSLRPIRGFSAAACR